MKKKIILAITAALTAVLFMAACNKDDGKKKGDDGDDEDDFVSAITIDGKFTDWAALPATQVKTNTSTATTLRAGIKTLKGYVDDKYVCIYIEYNPTGAHHMQVHLDVDNDYTTGADAWYFDQEGVEFVCEGHLLDENSQPVMFDPGISTWLEDEGWFGLNLIEAGNGVGNSSNPVSIGGGLVAMEIALVRELFPNTTWGSEIGLGMTLIDVAWQRSGQIPNMGDEDNAAPMLVVPVTITLTEEE